MKKRNRFLQFPLKVLLLTSGEKITMRHSLESDKNIFKNFLKDLSEETQKKSGLHPLTEEKIKKVINNFYSSEMPRFVLINKSNIIVGYFLFSFVFPKEEVRRYRSYNISLVKEKSIRFAPVIADAYQNKGLGSAMMGEVLEIARSLGIQRIVLWGGTQEANTNAIRFYKKFGFKKAGEFEKRNMNNFDMHLEL